MVGHNGENSEELGVGVGVDVGVGVGDGCEDPSINVRDVPETYLDPLVVNSVEIAQISNFMSDFNKCQEKFEADFELHLIQHPTMAKYYNDLVPDKVPHRTFMQRYFFRCVVTTSVAETETETNSPPQQPRSGAALTRQQQHSLQLKHSTKQPAPELRPRSDAEQHREFIDSAGDGDNQAADKVKVEYGNQYHRAGREADECKDFHLESLESPMMQEAVDSRSTARGAPATPKTRRSSLRRVGNGAASTSATTTKMRRSSSRSPTFGYSSNRKRPQPLRRESSSGEKKKSLSPNRQRVSTYAGLKASRDTGASAAEGGKYPGVPAANPPTRSSGSPQEIRSVPKSFATSGPPARVKRQLSEGRARNSEPIQPKDKNVKPASRKSPTGSPVRQKQLGTRNYENEPSGKTDSRVVLPQVGQNETPKKEKSGARSSGSNVGELDGGGQQTVRQRLQAWAKMDKKPMSRGEQDVKSSVEPVPTKLNEMDGAVENVKKRIEHNNDFGGTVGVTGGLLSSLTPADDREESAIGGNTPTTTRLFGTELVERAEYSLGVSGKLLSGVDGNRAGDESVDVIVSASNEHTRSGTTSTTSFEELVCQSEVSSTADEHPRSARSHAPRRNVRRRNSRRRDVDKDKLSSGLVRRDEGSGEDIPVGLDQTRSGVTGRSPWLDSPLILDSDHTPTLPKHAEGPPDDGNMNRISDPQNNEGNHDNNTESTRPSPPKMREGMPIDSKGPGDDSHQGTVRRGLKRWGLQQKNPGNTSKPESTTDDKIPTARRSRRGSSKTHQQAVKNSDSPHDSRSVERLPRSGSSVRSSSPPTQDNSRAATVKEQLKKWNIEQQNHHPHETNVKRIRPRPSHSNESLPTVSAEEKAQALLFNPLAVKSVVRANRKRNAAETYTLPLNMDSLSPSEDRMEFVAFQTGFNLSELEDDILVTLAKYPDSVGVHFNYLVPSTVTEGDFWMRYFYRCDEKRILRDLRRKALRNGSPQMSKNRKGEGGIPAGPVAEKQGRASISKGSLQERLEKWKRITGKANTNNTPAKHARTRPANRNTKPQRFNSAPEAHICTLDLKAEDEVHTSAKQEVAGSVSQSSDAPGHSLKDRLENWSRAASAKFDSRKLSGAQRVRRKRSKSLTGPATQLAASTRWPIAPSSLEEPEVEGSPTRRQSNRTVDKNIFAAAATHPFVNKVSETTNRKEDQTPAQHIRKSLSAAA